jgi:hypothetical protein
LENETAPPKVREFLAIRERDRKMLRKKGRK